MEQNKPKGDQPIGQIFENAQVGKPQGVYNNI